MAGYQIRNIPNVTGTAAAGFQDASLWEEAKKKGRKNFFLEENKFEKKKIVETKGC